ncbi:MAG: T9SS type A sorting domain-containing protein, partial [Rhodothermia bacterium]|nr:T9SS type A sorting domain-containing protein [Rhodothermia bacterium]
LNETAFDLTIVPDWLSPSIASGTIPPGGKRSISMVVNAELLTPNTRDTLSASTSFGDALLYVDTVCELTDWQVEAATFQFNMSVTGQLFVEGVVSDDPSDRVAAFVGNELRGVASVSDVGAGSNRVNLTVYSNNPSGETVMFQVFDASACRVFPGTSRTFTFVNGAALGTPEQPLSLDATDALAQQAIALAAGWTWFSLNREPNSTDMSRVLSTLLPRSGDVVKSQTAFSIYDDGLGAWVGSLTDIEPGSAYLLRSTNPNTLVVSGDEIEVASNPIDVVAGWNWIGYSGQASISINDALASFSATTDDLIKSQFQFAQYDGSTWVGSLTQIDPGLGYLLKANAPGQITYPDPPGTATRLASRSPRRTRPSHSAKMTYTDEKLPAGSSGHIPDKTKPDKPALTDSDENIRSWAITPEQYAHSMTMTAGLSIDGLPTDGRPLLIAATIDDEVRGVSWIRGEDAVAYMMIYSDDKTDDDVIEFMVYDEANGRIFEANETLDFVDNAIAGTPGMPFSLTVGTGEAAAEDAEELPTEFALKQNYPNPFNPETTIRYELPEVSHVTIEVFDPVGRLVSKLMDQQHEAGRYSLRVDATGMASGLYVYRMTAGEYTNVRKMVVLK